MNVGDTLATYVLRSEIASDRFGTTYRVSHTQTSKRFSLYLLKPEWSKSKKAIDAFWDEEKKATLLNLGTIAAQEDTGLASSTQAYTLWPMLEGETLATRLAHEGKVPVGQGMQWMRDICLALDGAHKAGLVHQALTPDRIFINQASSTETIVLSGFGFKHFINEGHRVQKQEIDIRYWAPEQCLGGSRVETRTDLYALGCIFFEALCAKPPFSGSDKEVRASHIRTTPENPRLLAPEMSSELEALLLTLLSKTPDSRVASAGECARILDGMLSKSARAAGPSIAPKPPGAPKPPIAAEAAASGKSRGPAPNKRPMLPPPLPKRAKKKQVPKLLAAKSPKAASKTPFEEIDSDPDPLTDVEVNPPGMDSPLQLDAMMDSGRTMTPEPPPAEDAKEVHFEDESTVLGKSLQSSDDKTVASASLSLAQLNQQMGQPPEAPEGASARKAVLTPPPDAKSAAPKPQYQPQPKSKSKSKSKTTAASQSADASKVPRGALPPKKVKGQDSSKPKADKAKKAAKKAPATKTRAQPKKERGRGRLLWFALPVLMVGVGAAAFIWWNSRVDKNAGALEALPTREPSDESRAQIAMPEAPSADALRPQASPTETLGAASEAEADDLLPIDPSNLRANGQPDRPADLVTFVVRSVPPGAAVVRMPLGIKMGETPYTFESLPDDGAVEFVIELAGYGSQTISFPADTGGEREVLMLPGSAASQIQSEVGEDVSASSPAEIPADAALVEPEAVEEEAPVKEVRRAPNATPSPPKKKTRKKTRKRRSRKKTTPQKKSPGLIDYDESF